MLRMHSKNVQGKKIKIFIFDSGVQAHFPAIIWSVLLPYLNDLSTVPSRLLSKYQYPVEGRKIAMPSLDPDADAAVTFIQAVFTSESLPPALVTVKLTV